eukprot:1509804-Rhodomonas_salina.1
MACLVRTVSVSRTKSLSRKFRMSSRRDTVRSDPGISLRADCPSRNAFHPGVSSAEQQRTSRVVS